MKIYLVRHGETTGDIEDRYGGSYDDHLTEKGREQLSATAQDLADKKIQTIFHSPLIRARESAEIIQSRISCELEEVDGLKERHYGILSGLTKTEALEKYPDVVEAHKDPMNTDPDGESFSDFEQRVLEAYESILEKDYEAVVILAHGGSLKRILNHIGAPIPDSIGDGEIIAL